MSWPVAITVPAIGGEEITIRDVRRFCRHLQDKHAQGVTTHVERGHSFRVDDDFRALVQHQVPGETLFD